MNEQTRGKLLADLAGRRQVFRPEKLLEEFEAGPYTVRLLRECRLEHDDEVWSVNRIRWYSLDIGSRIYHSEAEARAAFEELKERTIVDIACEALRINRVTDLTA